MCPPALTLSQPNPPLSPLWKTPHTLRQAVFYVLWGNTLVAWSFFFSSLSTSARPAVLTATVLVIVYGFVANLVLVQVTSLG